MESAIQSVIDSIGKYHTGFQFASSVETASAKMGAAGELPTELLRPDRIDLLQARRRCVHLWRD